LPKKSLSFPKNIFLIGFMATGKSHVGSILAREIGWRLVDADAEIVRRAGKPIEAIFQADGEPAFRALEASVLAELCGESRQVVATGGGAFLNPDSRQAMLERGLVLCLKARPETIFRRLGQTAFEAKVGEPRDEEAKVGEPGEDHPDEADRAVKREALAVRPLLAGNDALERIKLLLEERAGAYSQAHYSIATDDLTPEQVTRQIIEIWKAETSQGSSRSSRKGANDEGV
jgi:shikimate kinase